jgi:DNA-binding transcriptional ArsR family regulator
MSSDTGSRFQALADPTRRAILKQLREGSRTAGEIADAFHLTKPTLSHHFKVLEAAGLVRSERRGTFVVYTLQSNVLEDLAAEVLELSASLTAKRSAKGSST